MLPARRSGSQGSPRLASFPRCVLPDTRFRPPADPRLTVDGHGSSVVPNAGAVLLLRAAEAVGLDTALAQALEPWRRPMARHDPGKILLDLAVSLAVGGDCLADLAQLRAAPEVFGPVASDPTVSRLIDTLAAETPAALASARATARARA